MLLLLRVMADSTSFLSKFPLCVGAWPVLLGPQDVDWAHRGFNWFSHPEFLRGTLGKFGILPTSTAKGIFSLISARACFISSLICRKNKELVAKCYWEKKAKQRMVFIKKFLTLFCPTKSKNGNMKLNCKTLSAQNHRLYIIDVLLWNLKPTCDLWPFRGHHRLQLFASL